MLASNLSTAVLQLKLSVPRRGPSEQQPGL